MVKNIQSENFINVEWNRYQFLFGFENLVSVFRPKNPMALEKSSSKFDLVYSYENNCTSTYDVLLDLDVLVRSEQKELILNDVVGIKINGAVTCYRYLGKRNNVESIWDIFKEVEKFTSGEIGQIVSELHRNNQVLSVLDGKIISIKDIDFNRQMIFAIDGESFNTIDCYGKGYLTTDYSLYKLQNLNVINANPYYRPFFNINVALYHFLNNKEYKRNKSKKPILLLNRYELELIRDYYQIHDALLG